MSQRADGNKYSSMYGIDPSNGNGQWGVGGNSNSVNYAWRDLVCEGEVAYGVISKWDGNVFEHVTNRC